MKNAISILLVFALLMSFAACRKLENDGEFVIESRAYVVDNQGVTRDIHSVDKGDGEKEYYYYDENGNRIVVDSNNVVVETSKVRVTESQTLSPEAQSFFDTYNDPDKFEELIETNVTEPELEIAEDLIPDDNFVENNDVQLDSNGKPVNTGMEEYQKILSGETYTMDFIIKTTTNGETTILPVLAVRDGKSMYFETAMPVSGTGSMRGCFLILNEKCYLIIPAMRAYMVVSNEMVGELIPEDVLETEIESTFISSGEVDYGGKKYTCHVYEAEGKTVKYYYADNKLKRVETISEDDVAIVEINNISASVDKSKLKVPSGYLDMSSVLGADFDLAALS